jgi:toxin ParE1/3/4
MRVRYTPAAFSDRERILQYLRERSIGGARNVATSIRETVAQLREHPHSGYRTDDPDIRVIFVARYPYKIFLHKGCRRNPEHPAHVSTSLEERR